MKAHTLLGRTVSAAGGRSAGPAQLEAKAELQPKPGWRFHPNGRQRDPKRAPTGKILKNSKRKIVKKKLAKIFIFFHHGDC